LFFSTFPFPPAFICAHSYALPFPLLFAFNYTIYTHTVVNSKPMKTCTTSNNKRKLLSTITSLFLVLEHPACHIHFFICPLSSN
jgi:hypothetical protein